MSQPSLPGLHDRPDTDPQPSDPTRRLPQWPTGYDRGRCRSCNALIFWAISADALGTPKRRPDGSVVKISMDPFPVPDGNLMLVSPGKVAPIGAANLGVPRDERWRTHFATCPNASTHRRRPRAS